MEIQKYTSNTTQQRWRVHTFTQKCDYKFMLNTFVHNNIIQFLLHVWGQDDNKELLFPLIWHPQRAEKQWLCLGNILSVSSNQWKSSPSNPPGQFSALERNCWGFQSLQLDWWVPGSPQRDTRTSWTCWIRINEKTSSKQGHSSLLSVDCGA